MPVSFLCVQFRNLLPSEDLLLFARARWNEAQERGQVSPTAGDATLCITQTANKLAWFEVELRLADASLRSIGRDANPIAAVEEAFAQLGSSRDWTLLQSYAPLDENASGERKVAPTDTLVA
jgi:hypothetical protein